MRVRGLERYGPAGVRVHRPDVDLVTVAGGTGATVVADRQRQEVEHQGRVRNVLVASCEAATLEVIGRTRSAAKEQPFRPDERPTPLLGGGGLHRDRLEAPVLDVHLEVVLEVGT